MGLWEVGDEIGPWDIVFSGRRFDVGALDSIGRCNFSVYFYRGGAVACCDCRVQTDHADSGDYPTILPTYQGISK